MGRTLLIIDDSETVRQRVQEALVQHDPTTRFVMAKDGLEGFKLLVANHVDLILCDVVMPGIDGYKFLALKRSKPEFDDVPVIILTGAAGDVKAKVKGFEAGASDFLTKPFHDEELIARVNVHLKIKTLQDELREKNARLEELSNTDGLTKVTNRRRFMELFDLEFARAKRYKTELAYVMVDVDHFKQVNDVHGHQVGDTALVTVAAILREDLRKHDAVGRYGGEEFALLLPQTGLEGAKVVAERYRKRIADAELPVGEQRLRITVSMGIAVFPASGVEDADDLVRLADHALYEAKHAGRNRVIAAEPHK